MSDSIGDVMESVRQESEARSQALGRLIGGADSARVFGQPFTSGEYTVIPAAEVASGGGFGSGLGFNRLVWKKRDRGSRAEAPAEPNLDEGQVSTEAGEHGRSPFEAGGGGGGGGGGSMGRPVAVIVVGPDGVRVKPILDVTKLALTMLGAWGTVAALGIRTWGKR